MDGETPKGYAGGTVESLRKKSQSVQPVKDEAFPAGDTRDNPISSFLKQLNPFSKRQKIDQP